MCLSLICGALLSHSVSVSVHAVCCTTLSLLSRAEREPCAESAPCCRGRIRERQPVPTQPHRERRTHKAPTAGRAPIPSDVSCHEPGAAFLSMARARPSGALVSNRRPYVDHCPAEPGIVGQKGTVSLLPPSSRAKSSTGWSARSTSRSWASEKVGSHDTKSCCVRRPRSVSNDATSRCAP